jgi:hypothetical protein
VKEALTNRRGWYEAGKIHEALSGDMLIDVYVVERHIWQGGTVVPDSGRQIAGRALRHEPSIREFTILP